MQLRDLLYFLNRLIRLSWVGWLCFLFLIPVFVWGQDTTERVEEPSSRQISEQGTLINPDTGRTFTEKEYQDLIIEREINRTLAVRDGMLKAHEILGWGTIALLSINVFVTVPGPYQQGVHTITGIAGGSMYFTSASLGFFAPKMHDDLIILGGKKESPSKFIHKLLAFIHFPAMVATMALGFIVDGGNEGDLNISPQTRARMREAHTATSILTLVSLTMSMVVVYID